MPILITMNEIRSDKFDILFNFHQSSTTSNLLSIRGNAVKGNFTSLETLNKTTLKLESISHGETSFSTSSLISFEFGLSRNPGNLLFSLLLPIYVLDFFILACYRSNSGLSDSISNLATIMIALLAYLNGFRDVVPISSSFTFGDANVSLSLTLAMLCLLNAVVRDFYPDLVNFSRALFGISICIMGVLAIATFILYVMQKWKNRKQNTGKSKIEGATTGTLPLGSKKQSH
jgi:hypothetical protein